MFYLYACAVICIASMLRSECFILPPVQGSRYIQKKVLEKHPISENSSKFTAKMLFGVLFFVRKSTLGKNPSESPAVVAMPPVLRCFSYPLDSFIVSIDIGLSAVPHLTLICLTCLITSSHLLVDVYV